MQNEVLNARDLLKKGTSSPNVDEALIAEIKPCITIKNVHIDDSSRSLPDIAETALNHTIVQPHSLKAQADRLKLHHYQLLAGESHPSLHNH